MSNEPKLQRVRVWFATALLGLRVAACNEAADAVHDHDHDAVPVASMSDASTTLVRGHAADDSEDAGLGSDHYTWKLPRGFPEPWVPEDNPMSASKVELGRHLFYDSRLSDNQTQSCASCHKQQLAFSDGRATGLGSTGQAHPRGPMSLANVAYAVSLTWANPLFGVASQAEPLERQSELPLYGDAPVELGMTSPTELEQRLRAVPRYGELFARAFPGDPQPISAQNVGRALACFERSLISGRSPFDRYLYDDDTNALSAAQLHGYELFFGEKLECFHCHAGFALSDHVHYAGKAQLEVLYHNTGLYNLGGKGAYPASNTGVFQVTGEARDMGAFKAPSLRNIALTAPYMHDGSIASLSEVLDHYAAGGRTIAHGPNQGVGKDNRFKDKLVRGFALTAQERRDVLAFLESLTDEVFLTNPAFGDPWLAVGDEPDPP